MINWKDIQDKAVAFVHEWRDTKEEDKWAKAFWVRFFDIFEVREPSLVHARGFIESASRAR